MCMSFYLYFIFMRYYFLTKDYLYLVRIINLYYVYGTTCVNCYGILFRQILFFVSLRKHFSIDSTLTRFQDVIVNFRSTFTAASFELARCSYTT